MIEAIPERWHGFHLVLPIACPCPEHSRPYIGDYQSSQSISSTNLAFPLRSIHGISIGHIVCRFSAWLTRPPRGENADDWAGRLSSGSGIPTIGSYVVTISYWPRDVSAPHGADGGCPKNG